MYQKILIFSSIIKNYHIITFSLLQSSKFYNILKLPLEAKRGLGRAFSRQFSLACHILGLHHISAILLFPPYFWSTPLVLLSYITWANRLQTHVDFLSERKNQIRNAKEPKALLQPPFSLNAIKYDINTVHHINIWS